MTDTYPTYLYVHAEHKNKLRRCIPTYQTIPSNIRGSR